MSAESQIDSTKGADGRGQQKNVSGGVGVDGSPWGVAGRWERDLSPSAKLRARRWHAGRKREGSEGTKGQRRLTGCPVLPSTQKTIHDDTVNAKGTKTRVKKREKGEKRRERRGFGEGGIVCEAEVKLVGGLGLGLGQRTTCLGTRTYSLLGRSASSLGIGRPIQGAKASTCISHLTENYR